jgi:hypothetical protein
LTRYVVSVYSLDEPDFTHSTTEMLQRSTVKQGPNRGENIVTARKNTREINLDYLDINEERIKVAHSEHKVTETYSQDDNPRDKNVRQHSSNI